MDTTTILAALDGAAPGLGAEAAAHAVAPAILVPRERLLEAATALREADGLRFDVLVDIVGVDYWPGEPRFEVIYNLLSTGAPGRLFVKVRVPGDDAHVPTLSAIWPSAGFLEREVWDLFGVVFDGHGDLRRLLMPEDWEGHPLRKDYPVQIKMPPKVYEPLQMTEQEFRNNIEADRLTRETARQADKGTGRPAREREA